MKQIHFIFLLFFFPFFCLPVQSSSAIVLRGERQDYLYNISKAEVRAGAVTFNVKKWKKNDFAYYFAYKRILFRYLNHEITCSDSDWRLKVDGCLLPVPSSPESIQKMVHKGSLFLPVQNGFFVLDLMTRRVDLLDFPWRLKPISGGGIKISVPELAGSRDTLWVLDAGHLKRRVSGRWKEAIQVPGKDLVDTFLFSGRRFVNLLLFKVTQGDLGSFRTRLLSYSAGEGRLLMDREFDGILKNPGVDESGRLVFEYVKASIFSAFMGRNKVRLRIVDPGNRKVVTRSFSVGDKRRHLFFMTGKAGELLIIVQCKNGNVFVIAPFSGKMRELKKGKFNYDYTLIRGVGNGIFYNKKTGNCIPVSFASGSGGS